MIKLRKNLNVKFKSTNGITLVSLVVTIIVLIILAGISLNLTLGENGLFTMAKKAKENIELAQIEEQTRMNELYDELEQGSYYENPEIGELEDTIDKLNENIKSLEEQLESAKQEKQGLQENIQELNGQITTLQGQVAQQKTEIEEKKAKINELTSQVEEDKTSIEEKERQIEDLNKQVAQGKADLQEKQKEITDLTNQVEEAKTNIQNKQKEIDNLKSEKSELEQQVATKEATIQEKENQINSLNEQLNAKDTQIANQKQQITNLQNNKTELESQVANLKTQVAELEKEVSVNMVNVGDAIIPVPKGFYYVGGTKASGVVISDNQSDENKYANVLNGDVPAGVKYNENDGTVDIANSELKGNQFVWIPVELKDYKKISWGQQYQNTLWETQTNTAELTQIKKYGGFYIGRYEAGTRNITLSTGANFAGAHETTDWTNDNFCIREGKSTVTGKITCMAGEIPYYHADYFTALELCNNMYNDSNYVQSGLVTGTMWDTMLNFIAGDNRNIVTTESYWGNYNTDNNNVKYKAGQGRYTLAFEDRVGNFIASDGKFYAFSIRTTASTENAKKKNLYDIAGNLYEWTQEASYYNSTDGTLESYVLRGGSFYHNYSSVPVCYRGTSYATNTRTDIGFRPALYIR